MTSTTGQPSTKEDPSDNLPSEVQQSNAQPVQAHTREADIEEEDLRVDNDSDSAFGGSEGSETTSIASVCKGYYENGRRYQGYGQNEYFLPADEQQWESLERGHLLMLILDSKRSNTLFRSPISANAKHILDLGTGSGDWALDVADRFPNLTVHGVDLNPPPQITAPNCIFEVDDLTQDPWTWNHKWDLVHMRHMLAAFNDREYERMYKRIYHNLAPGGWIEQVEMDVGMFCDDDTLPADSILHYRGMFLQCGKVADRPFDTIETMRPRMESAGFINVHQQDYKMPIGAWPTQQVYKDAGRVAKEHYLSGVEGWTMFMLTHFGQPTPWSAEEVQVWLAKVRTEINAGHHIYQKTRRVWAQKPFDSKPNGEQKVEAENVQDTA